MQSRKRRPGLNFPGVKMLIAIFVRIISLPSLSSAPASHGADLQGKAEEGNESLRVVVVVQIACGKACQRLAVERVGGGGAGLDDVALVELEFHFAGHILLGGLHECLDSLTQGSKPLALVYDLSHLVAHVLL